MNHAADSRLAEAFVKAQLLQQQRQLEAARVLYQEILQVQPDHVDALNAMGVLAGQSKDLQQAIQYFDRAIAIAPDNSGVHCNRGLALRQLNQPAAALESLDRAIALDPQSAIAHYSRAETYTDLGRPEEAVAGYDAAIAINPAFLQASFKRGFLLQQMGRPQDAVASYNEVIKLNPDHFDARANMAVSLFALGRPGEALANCDRAIALKPDQAALHSFRGDLLRAMERPGEAAISYERAIALNPDEADVHCDRGAVLLLLEQVECIPCFDRAIELKPDFARAYFYRANAHHNLHRFDSATRDYQAVATLAPDYELLPGARLLTSLQVCDWSDFDGLVAEVCGGIELGKRVAHPFIVMALTDSARLQHKVARQWVHHAYPANDSLGAIAPRGGHGKLKIGYFSSDFREHPLGRLLVELIEIHDRSRFEIIAFSFGRKTGDDLEQRLMRAFDKFIDVREQSSLETAALARELEIDIAVDLTGHTLGNRARIFALRAAPVQVNYLGYLGTMGADYMDYIVADHTVVTRENELHFSEKVIYMPGSHEVNGRDRVVADETFTRDELDLPPSGIVFCCFNASYKILPAIFACWMRILKAVPESMLLLYARHETTESNLRTSATRHGVDPQRLIFGARLELPEYLARYRTTDLFLDTFPYTGGTTVSDALWVGLPVVTMTGESFVSRTAASLLKAIGAPELVTSTPEEYEHLAIDLASNPQRLAQIRKKIEDNRLTTPLFDTTRFARNLEAAFTAIHERHQAGLPPDHFRF
jgi:predicted O-linked N-acetylglucosamine transferase (SPINDLY family)